MTAPVLLVVDREHDAHKIRKRLGPNPVMDVISIHAVIASRYETILVHLRPTDSIAEREANAEAIDALRCRLEPGCEDRVIVL